MGGYSIEIAAERAGVDSDELSRLTELGILGADDGYSDADVRRVQVVKALELAGLPVEGLAGLLREGHLSLRFLDEAGVNVFAALSDTTFGELSERTGIPVEMLTVLRDASGGTTASPGDRVRERAGDLAARRIPDRARLSDGGDRTSAPGIRRQPAAGGRGGSGMVALRDPGADARSGRACRRSSDAARRRSPRACRRHPTGP